MDFISILIFQHKNIYIPHQVKEYNLKEETWQRNAYIVKMK